MLIEVWEIYIGVCAFACVVHAGIHVMVSVSISVQRNKDEMGGIHAVSPKHTHTNNFSPKLNFGLRLSGACLATKLF